MLSKKDRPMVGIIALIVMLWLAMMALTSCGQTNQAMDCMRQGNQCADESTPPEAAEIEVIPEVMTEPAPCSIVQSPDVIHPIEITVLPTPVVIEEDDEEVVIYQCKNPRKYWRRHGHH